MTIVHRKFLNKDSWKALNFLENKIEERPQRKPTKLDE